MINLNIEYSMNINAEIQNVAVSLGLEWGEHWMAPIPPRLLQRFPQVTTEQANEMEALSRAVQKFAFALYEEVYFERTTRAHAEAQILERFPFLDETNLTRLYNQGMYYAWHG